MCRSQANMLNDALNIIYEKVEVIKRHILVESLNLYLMREVVLMANGYG